MFYAMQIMTGQEEKTEKLCRTIIEQPLLSDIFYPQAETMRKCRGIWIKISEPLFPGYLFADTNHVEKLFSKLKLVPRLTRLLGVGMTPIPLSDGEAGLLGQILNGNHTAEFSIGFIEGDRLVIESGAMKGMEGMVKKIDRHKRIAFLEIDMFGRKVDMKLGLEVVRKA